MNFDGKRRMKRRSRNSVSKKCVKSPAKRSIKKKVTKESLLKSVERTQKNLKKLYKRISEHKYSPRRLYKLNELLMSPCFGIKTRHACDAIPGCKSKSRKTKSGRRKISCGKDKKKFVDLVDEYEDVTLDLD